MEKYKEIEKSIIKTYRKEIWARFVKAIKDYNMVEENDKIAVCISGGKDSFLMAKCFQELERHSDVKFEAKYIVMNPGYNEKNLNKIINNAKLLNIPITIFETTIFESVERITENPCYLCARMRRGYLYNKAQEMGCNKIALGHHFNDVIETVLMGMLYGAQFQTMMPKVNSTNHPGMQLIRPMYYIREDDVITWRNYNELDFIQCACRFTENVASEKTDSKRKEMKELIKKLKEKYDNIDVNILKSTENVNLDTVISYKQGDKVTHFLDDYDKKRKDIVKKSKKNPDKED